MWLSSFILFLQSLSHAGPTGSLKPLGLLVGQQEHPLPPTPCEPQHGAKKQGREATQGREAIPAALEQQLRALEPGAPSFATLHQLPTSPLLHLWQLGRSSVGQGQELLQPCRHQGQAHPSCASTRRCQQHPEQGWQCGRESL